MLATTHLAAIALLFGSIVITDLRLLGLSRHLAVRQLSRHVLPWTMIAFLLAVATGSVLFRRPCRRAGEHRVFILKMGLIRHGRLSNAAIFHTGPYTKVGEWDSRRAPPAGARLCAGVSILIWLAVITCGRVIASPMSLPLDKLVEERHPQPGAEQEGVFDNLPGAGQPLQPRRRCAGAGGVADGLPGVLKNAGYVPPEIEQLRELRQLEARWRWAKLLEISVRQRASAWNSC